MRMRKEDSLIKAITIDEDIAKISVMEVPDKPGIACNLFSSIANEGIKIESITQNVNRSQVNDITFTVPTDEDVYKRKDGDIESEDLDFLDSDILSSSSSDDEDEEFM